MLFPLLLIFLTELASGIARMVFTSESLCSRPAISGAFFNRLSGLSHAALSYKALRFSQSIVSFADCNRGRPCTLIALRRAPVGSHELSAIDESGSCHPVPSELSSVLRHAKTGL